MKRVRILPALLLILSLCLPAAADVLPETHLTGCFPVLQGDDFDPLYPVPFGERFRERQRENELEIWFGRISVCDGFIVRCNGETMLIDGGDFNHGRETMAFLSKLGVTGVDYIFNTHHHDDHLGMQIYLMNHDFTAKEFLTPYERDYNIPDQRKAEAAADAHGIAYHVIRDGDEMTLGGENGARICFYRWGGSTDPNFSSVFCRITLGERSVILMADVISKAQQQLAIERPEIPWKSDIMKAGHHGYTPQDTQLMKMIDPELVVVTNSPLGGKKTIDQMKRLGIPTLITNRGTVYVHTDGGEHWYYMQDKSYRK